MTMVTAWMAHAIEKETYIFYWGGWGQENILQVFRQWAIIKMDIPEVGQWLCSHFGGPT